VHKVESLLRCDETLFLKNVVVCEQDFEPRL